MQPLADVLVLDFTTLLPGPLATLMLAEAGAQVIKIERPGGEDMRRYEPRFDGESAMFAMLNRGKQSLVLDLKDSADRARLMPLVKRADVLVEQFRPGVMARLGLGANALRKVNPRLIYCSITGYGQSGPRAAEAGHDINYIGATGLLALQPGPLDRPNVPPALIADIGGGTLPAVMNILLALRQRDRTGKGCAIDIAMADAMFTFAGHPLAVGHITGQFPVAGNARLTGGSPRYQLYPTKDGKLVACGALEQKFWLAFTSAIGLAPEFVDDRSDPQATKRAVAAIIASRTRGGMAAGARGRGLLRHYCNDAGGGVARPAFRRAWVVLASSFRSVRCDHAGAAGADRSGVSRQAQVEAAAGARRRQRPCQSASPRISRGCEAEGATPSRNTARRKGPIRSMR